MSLQHIFEIDSSNYHLNRFQRQTWSYLELRSLPFSKFNLSFSSVVVCDSFDWFNVLAEVLMILLGRHDF